MSQVGQWMVGIKRLIQEARNVSPVGSPESSQRAPPSLIKSTEGEEGNGSATHNNGEQKQEEAVQQTTTESVPLETPETIDSAKDSELNSETPTSGEGS